MPPTYKLLWLCTAERIDIWLIHHQQGILLQNSYFHCILSLVYTRGIVLQLVSLQKESQEMFECCDVPVMYVRPIYLVVSLYVSVNADTCIFSVKYSSVF